MSVSEMILGEVESRHWDAVQNKMAMLEAAYHNELTELARLKVSNIEQSVVTSGGSWLCRKSM